VVYRIDGARAAGCQQNRAAGGAGAVAVSIEYRKPKSALYTDLAAMSTGSTTTTTWRSGRLCFKC